MPVFTLDQLCQKLEVAYEGDGSTQLQGVAEITAAKKGDISFVANPKYVSKINLCNASAIIIPNDLETEFRPVIRSENPYLTFTKALHLFHRDNRRISGGVHISSQVSPTVALGKDVTIMPHAIIQENVVIGDRVVIYPGVFIGRDTVIGDEVTLYPHVSIAAGCQIDALSIIHAGCRIGSVDDMQSPPSGYPVHIEKDVELGANVVIAGIPEAPTLIGEGTKIDNLVQIGAGCRFGSHCIIVSQVTIGDHAAFGDGVAIAGQVVISPGIKIGDFSRIGAKSVVVDDVPPNSIYWGIPAKPHREEKRLKANLARLPRIFEKIHTLEKQMLGNETKNG